MRFFIVSKWLCMLKNIVQHTLIQAEFAHTFFTSTLNIPASVRNGPATGRLGARSGRRLITRVCKNIASALLIDC